MTSLADQIVHALQEHGPLTARELAEELGARIKDVTATLVRIRKRHDAHVCGWRRDEDGGRLYPRALYQAGPGVDARRPKALTHTENHRRAVVGLCRISSVFDLAFSKRELRSGKRWTP